jgi:mono/diheme cytochrome c family protein
MRPAVLVILAMSVAVGSVYLSSVQSSAASVQRTTRAAIQIEQGRKLYTYWCATCHGAGVGAEGRAQLPGTAALQEKYQGDPPALLEDRTDLTPEAVTLFVRNGISVMPFFRKTEISDEEMAAINAYLTRPRAGRRK